MRYPPLELGQADWVSPTAFYTIISVGRHTDFFGWGGGVAIRRPERIEVSNPGLLSIPLDPIESGGIFDFSGN